MLVPENKFLQLWQFLISILLCITAIYVPIKVAFIDESNNDSMVFDFTMDGLFAIDIVIMFFTALERRGGVLETRLRYIAKDYLKMWFWIDFLSTMPVELIEQAIFPIIE